MSAVRTVAGGATHTGLVRQKNEDAFLLRDEASLWAISDGMGGHKHGEFASAHIIHLLETASVEPGLDEGREAVELALREANEEIWTESQRLGVVMGATAVVLRITERTFQVVWAGDSRAYLLRRGQLYQLSIDHTRVQELVDFGHIAEGERDNHPMGHVLARAVGVEPALTLDVVQDQIEDGDTFLLCSDGLTGVLSDAEIAAVLAEGQPRQAVDDLIEAVLAGGAPDNVTIIAVSCRSMTVALEPEI